MESLETYNANLIYSTRTQGSSHWLRCPSFDEYQEYLLRLPNSKLKWHSTKVIHLSVQGMEKVHLRISAPRLGRTKMDRTSERRGNHRAVRNKTLNKILCTAATQ